MKYPQTKLPNVGLTIFSKMSALAAEKGAINLSQGFPDYQGPQALLDSVAKQVAAGMNQYAPMNGMPALRRLIADKVERLYGRSLNPDAEICVTPGATEALFSAIASTVRAGDEVIIFDPAYDSYRPAVELNGGVPISLPLLPPTFAIDWEALRAAISPRTRMIIVNTPHNPTGQAWSPEDLDALEAAVRDTDILILSDEVYEHLIFDGLEHQSMNRRPALAERSFIVSSFGKTYHVTGWRVGYCVAPAVLMSELQKVHQYVTFNTHTPLQCAIADFMQQEPDYPLGLGEFFSSKRDRLARGLAASRFKLLNSSGTYFQLVDYTAISDLPDDEFVLWLLEAAGVAAIPLSPFYQNGLQTGCVRLCFAKQDETIDRALEGLCRV